MIGAGGFCVHGDVVGGSRACRELNETAQARSVVVVGGDLRQRIQLVAGIDCQQRVEWRRRRGETVERVESRRAAQRCRPAKPDRSAAGVGRVVWFPGFLGGTDVVSGDKTFRAGDDLSRDEVVVSPTWRTGG